MLCSQKPRIIDPKNRALPIVQKVWECLQDGTRLCEVAFRVSASTTTVFSSLLYLGRAPGIPVVLKFWNTNNRPSPESLRVHNLYVALRKLKERGEITNLVIPRVYYSFLELRDGRVLILPINAQIEENNPGLETIKNQLLIVDDLAEGKGHRVTTVLSNSQIPSELKEGVDRDLAQILRYMTKKSNGDLLADLFESLFVIESNPPKVAIGDVDKLDPIIVPGINRFEIE